MCFPRYNNQLTLMRRDLRNCKGKIAEQQKQILEYASRLDETDRKNEETSRKFSTLLQVSVAADWQVNFSGVQSVVTQRITNISNPLMIPSPLSI
jgi:F-box protein 28